MPERRTGTGRPRRTTPRDGQLAIDARVRELEAELAAAQRTIDVLLDKAEQTPRDATPQSVLAEQVEARTRELAEKTAAVEAANSELRAVTSNLDQIVRQRTRALAESEEQLREKNAELERQSSAKADFISIVAHELRTPLTSIVGYLELMAEGRFGDLPETAERPIGSLRRNANRLKRLVDEMLDVSRIEAGKIILRRTRVSLADVVRDVVIELAPLAEGKQQAVTTELADVPAVHGDADKIHQIVVNLLSNSIRYTPESGRITIAVDQPPIDRFPGRWARLRVRDTGIGIAASQRSRLFEPFTDVTPAKHHTSSGPDSAGLGLYIARGLTELHGGLIAVDSQEEVYTEFTVLLPLA